MTDEQLWRRGYWLLNACRWESQHTVHEVDAMLEDLHGIFKELHMRGLQLQLSYEVPAFAPRSHGHGKDSAD